MKIISNSNRRNIIGILAVLLIAAAGILLAQQLVGPGISAAERNQLSVRMDPVQRNYDWGKSKIGGQDQEDLHRNHLDNNFRVQASNRSSHMDFKIFVPNRLNLGTSIIPFTKIAEDKVDYSVESVFHKYVNSKQACNNYRSDDAVQLQGSDTVQTNPQGPQTIVNRRVVSPSNENQYACLVVKLKGAIRGGNDTHPEWVFVSSERIQTVSPSSSASNNEVSATGQLTEIDRFTVAPTYGVKATFTVNFKDSSNPRPIAGVKYYNKLVQSPTCSKRPQLYKTSSPKTGRRVFGADEYRIDLDLETQRVCIMVTLSDTNEYHGPHTIPLGIKSITSNNSGNLVATANRRNVTWRNFGPNSNGTCNANTFNVPPH